MVTLDDLQKTKNILFVNHLLAMGDAFLLSPIFKAVKDNLPGASVTVLTRSYAKDFVRAIPNINDVIDIETAMKLPANTDSLLSRIAALLRLAYCFKKQGYDCIILRNDKRLPHMRKLYLAARLCGARLILVNSYLEKYVKESRHIVETYYRILEDIGIRVFEKGRLYVTLSCDSVERGRDHLKSKGIEAGFHKIVGICPTSNLMVKNWSFKKVGKLCEEIGDNGKIVVFSTHKNASNEIAKFTKFTPVFIGHTMFDDLLGLISLCDVFVGVDTGPTHAAAALGVPTIGLYGPTSGVVAGPYGKDCMSIQAKEDCPDYKPLCLFSPLESLQDCYVNDKCSRFVTTCVDTIDPGEVTEKVKMLLGVSASKNKGLK